MNSITTYDRAPLSEPVDVATVRRARQAVAQPRPQPLPALQPQRRNPYSVPKPTLTETFVNAPFVLAERLLGFLICVVLPVLMAAAFLYIGGGGLFYWIMGTGLVLTSWCQGAKSRRTRLTAKAGRAWDAAVWQHKEDELAKLQPMTPEKRAAYVTAYEGRTGYWHPYRLREPIT